MTIRLICATLWAALSILVACGGEDPSTNPMPSPTVSPSPTPDLVTCNMDRPCTDENACVSGFCNPKTQAQPIDCSHLSWLVEHGTFNCTDRDHPNAPPLLYNAVLDTEEAQRRGVCVIRDGTSEEQNRYGADFGMESQTHGRLLLLSNPDQPIGVLVTIDTEHTTESFVVTAPLSDRTVYRDCE